MFVSVGGVWPVLPRCVIVLVELGIPGVSKGVEIGVGSSATVYRASQDELGRDVAVKVLRQTDPEFIRRFEREAKALGRLSLIPGVVTVFDTGVNDAGQPYMMLELCQSSLRDRLQTETSLDESEACRIMSSVAMAVASAHEVSIVHGDLKPGNVLVAADGRHLVADFGLSTIDEPTDAPGEASEAVGFTVPYAAKEVVGGEPYGAPADVYALGAMLYHLLAGQPPFYAATDETVAPVLARITNEDPPPLDAAIVSPKVSKLVERALSKDPAARPTAGEFGVALAAVGAEVDERSDAEEKATDVAAEPTNGLRPVPASSIGPGSAHILEGLEPQGPQNPQVIGSSPPVIGSNLPVASGIGLADELNPGYVARVDERESGFVDFLDRWGTERIIALVALPLALIAVGSLLYLNFAGGERSDVIAGAGTTIEAEPAAPDVDAESSDNPSATVTSSPIDRTVEVVVPNVIGSDIDNAVEFIEAAGLRVLRVDQESAQDAGTVLSQSPSQGLALEGALVTLTVATARPVPTVRVPNVIGKTADAAEADLAAADLGSQRRGQRFDNSPAGTVLATEPSAGTTVNVETEVGLIVSRGRPLVPDLVGSTVAGAEQALSGVTLVATQSTEVNFLVPQGEVLGSTPTAGTRVDVRSSVNLVVSSGPSCDVVNVVGETEQDARLLLLGCPVEAATVAEPSATATPGTVIRVVTKASSLQLVVAESTDCGLVAGDYFFQPIANLQSAVAADGNCELVTEEQVRGNVPAGTVVSITIEGGVVSARVSIRPTCVMPNVVGQLASVAEAQIRLAGCQGPISGATGLAIVSGSNPAAGTSIANDAPIQLSQAAPPAPQCVVPLVFALPQAAAVSAIQAANCTAVVVPIPVPAGDPSLGVVRNQSPQVGTSLVNGAAVTIEVGVAQ